MDMNILITGAARGLGLSLVKEFLRKGHMVFAGVLDLNIMPALKELGNHEKLEIFKLDMSLEEDILEVPHYINSKTVRLNQQNQPEVFTRLL